MKTAAKAPVTKQAPSFVYIEANHAGISNLCRALWEMEFEYTVFDNVDTQGWVRNAILGNLQNLNRDQEKEIRACKKHLEALEAEKPTVDQLAAA